MNEGNLNQHSPESYKSVKKSSAQKMLNNGKTDNANVGGGNTFEKNLQVSQQIEKASIPESSHSFADVCSCNCTRKGNIWWINFWASISIPQAIKKPFFMFTIVVLTIIKLLWDAEDVTIDAYLFYQLEMGGVIDNGIYRNGKVDKFVLAFSVLGCLKLLFWLRIIGAGRGVGMAEMLTGMPNGTKFLDPLKLLCFKMDLNYS